MPTETKVRIAPGVVPWLRLRLAVVCARWGWDAAVRWLANGVFEVVE